MPPTEAGSGAKPPQGFAASQSTGRTLAEIGVLLLLLALVLLGARGCAGYLTQVITMALPAEVDAAIGKAGGEAMRAQHAAAPGRAPTSAEIERVERVFGELRGALRPAEAKALGAPRVTVMVDEQVNAFALPGGEVFVLTGLLERVGTDDDLLRGVLAHELGHAVHRHGVRSLVRSGIYAMALMYVLGDFEGIVATVVAGASQLEQLSYSRSMEEESDAFGVDLLARTGRGPEGLARFLESLESQPVPELLSTHPDPMARARAIRDK